MASLARLLRPDKFDTDPGTPAADLKYCHWKETFENYLAIENKDDQCLAHLSKVSLPAEQAKFIWQSIVSFHNGTANIPDNVLMVLHWVTTAVMPEDYANMTLASIDVIQNFGLNYDLNEAQLSAIADRVKQDFAGKLPEDYTYYDLLALRQILCAFNRSEIEKIQPSAYREAALIIGKLERCNTEVMRGFAKLAVDKNVFGPPGAWSETTVKILGKVAEFCSKE
ncbi:hypothetical protein K1T71_000335 [Dendrolimus kikuchii]|uniref:Uncharacterized protein n=1 Tax=Dendrolimus kikuchii TaxID=765133 RepID=A0ACC1DJX2_9NEOP|nr:hypothetical protein K1T71_000335 [Dendrolimus kikuchii]